MAISIDLVRPSLAWLISNAFRRGQLVAALTAWCDPEGFARLRELCEREVAVSTASASRTIYRAALIVAGKGGALREITTGDVLELLDAENAVYGKSIGDGALLYRMLHTMGCFGEHAPMTLRQLRTGRQLTPDELIDRYRLRCQPVRDLMVDYLRERQPALDYTSLESLAGLPGQPCSGPTSSDITRASTTCTCPSRSPPPGSSGCAPPPERSSPPTAHSPKCRPTGSTTANA